MRRLLALLFLALFLPPIAPAAIQYQAITPYSVQLNLPGNVVRYGADPTGVNDSAAAFNSAIAAASSSGSNYVFVPPGTYLISSAQVLFGNNLTIFGLDRTATVIKCSLAAATSCLRYSNNGTSSPAVNTSGYGRVNIKGITITTSIAGSTAGALELSAEGFAYFELRDSRITGAFKYGVIADGVEVAHIENNIIDNSGPANSANIWIVNGPDRVLGQNQGFSNSLTIANNELNGGTYGIADDGGSNHYIVYNNINGNSLPIRFAGVNGFAITGNEIENAGIVTGEANVDFLSTALSSTSVGTDNGGVVSGNFFGADMASGGSSLYFNGTGTHTGVRVEGNTFRENLGLAADINVTHLGSSVVGPDYTLDTSSSGHYTGIHNDSSGNVLLPPQTGYAGLASGNASIFGDNRTPMQFAAGVDSLGGTLKLDSQKWQQFDIVIQNNAGTLQHQIIDNAVQGAAATNYVDRVNGESATFANTPTVSSSVGFTNGVGIVSGSLSSIDLDTAAQSSSLANVNAQVVYYTGSAAACPCIVYAGLASRNINGVTQYRPEIRLINQQTGAAVNFDTTLLPSGKQIQIQVSGFIQ